MTMSLTHETIKLMVQSKRHIKKEFGVNIDLDDDQAIALFLAYASKSSSDELKECTAKLMGQLIPSNKAAKKEKTEDVSKSSVKYYRGQRIVEPEPVVKATEPAKPTAQVQKKEVIYRGQKVVY